VVLSVSLPLPKRRRARFRSSIPSFLFTALLTLAGNLSTLSHATCATAARSNGEQHRALIWIRTKSDPALVERVLGQVSDLDIALLVKHTTEAEPPIPTDSGVFAVVWFSRPDLALDRIVVHVSETSDGAGRQLVRTVGSGSPTSNQQLESATLEAAALVVRAALRELGSEQPQSLHPGEAQEPEEETEPTPPSTAADGAPGLLVDAGWSAVFDGLGSGFSTAPRLHLGAHFGSFNVSALGTTGLPTLVDDEYGTMTHRRHSLGARVGYEFWISESLSLDLAFVVGAALHDRRVMQINADVQAVKDRTSASLLLGPELRLGWRFGKSPFDIGACAALYAVPQAPRVGYEIDGTFAATSEIRKLQPSFGITVKAQSLGFW